jgi:Domain of unknown function (DUF4145)
MKCPHCLTDFHYAAIRVNLKNPNYAGSTDRTSLWCVDHATCPACEKVIVFLLQDGGPGLLAIPRAISRTPLSKDVPDEFAQDYREACLVLGDSPKASAALSRRCLQHIFREKAKTKKKDLADQIEEVIPSLPSYLAGLIDGVRVIGNFAAHPIKSTNTGEISRQTPNEVIPVHCLGRCPKEVD